MKSSLHIHVAQRQGITYLKESYFTPPFKVANITEDKKANQLHLMLMSSSPGILEGDEYDMLVELEENCSLQLHTQSYQRLFHMKNGEATQVMRVRLQKGASFVYLPHPSVPHENSSFVAKNTIHLEGDCELIWGEILTCGRKLNGEEFKLSAYHNITQVYIKDKLVIKENLLMKPATTDITAMGQLEGFTHQSSFIYLYDKTSTEQLTDTINEYLSAEKEVVYGVSTTQGNGIIVRILGYKAEQLHNCLKQLAKICRLVPQIR